MEAIQLLEPKLESLTEKLQAFQWPEKSESTSGFTEQTELVGEAFQWDALRVTSDDRCVPRPVSFKWEGCRTQSENMIYDLLISTSARLENPAVHKDIVEPYRNVANLQIGTRYYWKVIARDRDSVLAMSPVWTFTTHPAAPRWLHVQGITNVRDMGGWRLPGNRRVRQGLIYRSSEMNRRVLISEEGKRVVHEELKIRTDLDLRGAGENDTCWPALDESAVQWINIPVRPYEHIVADDAREQYRQVFKVFANPSAYPLLFHCWGGCDRGGTVAFLLHALLGLDRDSLIRDYEYSSLSIWGQRSHLSENFQSLLNALEPFGDTKNDFGKQVENYLLSSGLTEKEIVSIRNHLTEEQP